MKETTSQIKNSRIDRALSVIGLRDINGVTAEIPEKLERYDHDRSGIINTMQNIIKAHNKRI